MAAGNLATAEHAHQLLQETSFESECRRAGNFEEVEHNLLERWSGSEVGFVDKATALLGLSNPFAHKANPRDNIVWLLDSTAYRPLHPYPHDPQPWQAEFVACFFRSGRQDIGKFVSNIADQIGLGDEDGDQEARERIAERIQPFINAIAPAHSIDVSIPCSGGPPHLRTLGPANPNGISSEIILTGGGDRANGTVIKTTSADDLFPDFSGDTRFASPEGWGIISDIGRETPAAQSVKV